MLATPVGIQRDIERDVRRSVAGQDGLGKLIRDNRLRRRRLVGFQSRDRPAVVETFAAVDFVAALEVGHGATPLVRRQGPRGDHDLALQFHVFSPSLLAIHYGAPEYCMDIQYRTPA